MRKDIEYKGFIIEVNTTKKEIKERLRDFLNDTVSGLVDTVVYIEYKD